MQLVRQLATRSQSIALASGALLFVAAALDVAVRPLGMVVPGLVVADVLLERRRRRRRHGPVPARPVISAEEVDPLWPRWPQVAVRAELPSGWPTPDDQHARWSAVFEREVSRRPSYMYKLAESKRRTAIVGGLGARAEPFRYNVKVDAYGLADRIGIRIPEQYGPPTPIDDVDFARLPDRAVVKATHGSTNRGVFLLVRRGPDRFVDLMDGREKSAADVRAVYHEHLAAKHVTATVLVEELLAPRPDIEHLVTIPDDLKLYCFYGRVVMIMQRRLNGSTDRSRWTFRLWTEDWRDLGAVKYRDRLDPGLAAPSGGAEVVESARRLSAELAIPFVRLDFYDTARGPVFGEVTPHPGPPEVVRADVDEFLGREWEVAEAKFLADGRSWCHRPGG
jgi:hypothetical protein